MPGRLSRAFPVLPTLRAFSARRRGSPLEIQATAHYHPGRLSARPRVLIVDDLDTNRFLLEEALGGVEADILTAGGGREAIAIVERLRPEVVVVDFQMPIMSGAQTSRRIKDAPTPFTYVILTSGYREAEESASFASALADRFMAKPYRLDELRAAVEEGLRVAHERRGH